MQSETLNQELRPMPEDGYRRFGELSSLEQEDFNINLQIEHLNKRQAAEVAANAPSIHDPVDVERAWGVRATVPAVIVASGNELMVLDISSHPKGQDGLRELRDGSKVDSDMLLINPHEYDDSNGHRGIIPIGNEPLEFGKTHPAVQDGSFGKVPLIRDKHFTITKEPDGELSITADTSRPTEVITAKPATVETYDVAPALDAPAETAVSSRAREAVTPDTVMAFGKIMRDEMRQLIWKSELTQAEADLTRTVIAHGSRMMLHALNRQQARLPERMGYDIDYDDDIAQLHNLLPHDSAWRREYRETSGQEFGYDPQVTSRLLESITDGIGVDERGQMLRGRSEEIAMRIMSVYAKTLRYNELHGPAINPDSFLESNYGLIQDGYNKLLAERAQAEAR